MRSGKGFEDWSLDEIVEDYEKARAEQHGEEGRNAGGKNQLQKI